IREITKPGFLEEVKEKGRFLVEKLKELQREFPHLIEGVRGLGLMVGAVMKVECSQIAGKALERGLIINCTAGKVLRFTPPLVITKEEIEKGIEILRDILREL
ncbi:MAG: aminotransferase class III-fold pyridoxal phosphate-dependent enzyme, partial [Desulfurobacteriaceae bacterium]